MAKRFTSTELWSEDWFLEMPIEYKLFWHYILSSCNHAGIFRVNLKTFSTTNGVSISAEEALKLFNNGKDRIRVIADGVWMIEDFFQFQYGATFNIKNRVHESIAKEWQKYGIDPKTIRGLVGPKQGATLTPTIPLVRPQPSPIVDPNIGVKDKDIDKDSLGNEYNTLAGENFEPSERLMPVEELADGAVKDDFLVMAAMTQANVTPAQLPAAKEKFPDVMKDFVVHLKSEGKHQQTFQGFRNHFKNWFAKRINSKQPPAPPGKAQALSATELLAQRQIASYVPPKH